VSNLVHDNAARKFWAWSNFQTGCDLNQLQILTAAAAAIQLQIFIVNQLRRPCQILKGAVKL
jgi:hypothetical protein